MKRSFRFLAALVAGFVATAACAQITYPNPIRHIIVVDQENRSMDNLMGSNAPSNQYYLPGLDVATSGQAYTTTNGEEECVHGAVGPDPAGHDAGKRGQH